MGKILNNIRKKVYGSVYIAGLILNRNKRQVCTNMSKSLCLSHDKVYRSLKMNIDKLVLFNNAIKKIVKLIGNNQRGNIIIDDTGVSKFNSFFTEAVSSFYNEIKNKLDYGFKIFVIVWTDGKNVIPLGFRYYLSKDISEDLYKTKLEILKELLDEVGHLSNFSHLLGDGHFSTIEIMKTLINRQITFVFKIAKNKKVTTEDGISAQIQHHPSFKMQRNQRSKVVPVTYYGMLLYVSVHKFKNLKTLQWNYLYLVSNCYYHAKSYLKLYKQRWNIEVFFRTIKQDFGLAHCQSRSFKIQQAHTRSIFVAYTFFKYNKILDHDESVSDLKQTSIVSSIASFCHNFGYYA